MRTGAPAAPPPAPLARSPACTAGAPGSRRASGPTALRRSTRCVSPCESPSSARCWRWTGLCCLLPPPPPPPLPPPPWQKLPRSPGAASGAESAGDGARGAAQAWDAERCAREPPALRRRRPPLQAEPLLRRGGGVRRQATPSSTGAGLTMGQGLGPYPGLHASHSKSASTSAHCAGMCAAWPRISPASRLMAARSRHCRGAWGASGGAAGRDGRAVGAPPGRLGSTCRHRARPVLAPPQPPARHRPPTRPPTHPGVWEAGVQPARLRRHHQVRRVGAQPAGAVCARGQRARMLKGGTPGVPGCSWWGASAAGAGGCRLPAPGQRTGIAPRAAGVVRVDLAERRAGGHRRALRRGRRGGGRGGGRQAGSCAAVRWRFADAATAGLPSRRALAAADPKPKPSLHRRHWLPRQRAQFGSRGPAAAQARLASGHCEAGGRGRGARVRRQQRGPLARLASPVGGQQCAGKLVERRAGGAQRRRRRRRYRELPHPARPHAAPRRAGPTHSHHVPILLRRHSLVVAAVTLFVARQALGAAWAGGGGAAATSAGPAAVRSWPPRNRFSAGGGRRRPAPATLVRDSHGSSS